MKTMFLKELSLRQTTAIKYTIEAQLLAGKRHYKFTR